MKTITIRTIPHNDQRYETPGDWWFEPDGSLQILVSDMDNPDYEALVAIHELVEVLLCQKRGITQEAVDAFDKKFEEERKEGKHSPEDEPGDDPAAPYGNEHFMATAVEELLAAQFEVDWHQYAEKVQSLAQTPKP